MKFKIKKASKGININTDLIEYVTKTLVKKITKINHDDTVVNIIHPSTFPIANALSNMAGSRFWRSILGHRPQFRPILELLWYHYRHMYL